MLFLLRTAFWLTLVLVLIPIGSDQESTSNENVDAVSAYLAAQAAVSDIGGFCGRNPEACETGGDAISAIGSRARDGARIVYEFLDTKVASQPATEPLVTGSTINNPIHVASESGYERIVETITLTPSFGPMPRPKPRSDI